ncbi:hypothetical protein B0F90DRAFT_1727394 [Multifurca ochricompacta]|uniref:Uncharacterized protein n=1 Tax=Multifurca ochricompacta TaxID=376703 RepID=A0AAD4M2B6_9AGAM|nr:hypothetical protein B0F90DRAFT_1727394 [Multifurca ochricompacta]
MGNINHIIRKPIPYLHFIRVFRCFVRLKPTTTYPGFFPLFLTLNPTKIINIKNSRIYGNVNVPVEFKISFRPCCQ